MQNYFAEKINPANLHHLYLIEGDSETVLGLCDFLGEQVSNFSANPDITVEHFESFGVDESRILKKRHSESAFGAGPRFFIMNVLAFGHEAEQSLLKIFEEPALGTHFFVVVSSVASLAPTLKSRAEIILSDGVNKDSVIDVKSWITKNIPDRLADIKSFLDSYKDDETTGRLRHDAVQFLSALEIALHSKWNEQNRASDFAPIFSDLNHFRDFLNDRGVPAKMLLEHIALTTPII